MRKGRLENWHEINFAGETRLTGNIFECDYFESGEQMITSGIVKYHNIMGRIVVETNSGSMYFLGEPAKIEKSLTEILNEQSTKRYIS